MVKASSESSVFDSETAQGAVDRPPHRSTALTHLPRTLALLLQPVGETSGQDTGRRQMVQQAIARDPQQYLQSLEQSAGE